MKIRPLYDRVLVKTISEEEISQGGIVIPDVAKEKPQSGEVIAIGAGRKSSEQVDIPIDGIRVGDIVLFGKDKGVRVEYDSGEYLIIREDDLLAVMEMFVCEMCGEKFAKAISDAEALEETHQIFGDVPKEELAVVCDDCFKKLPIGMKQ